MNTSFSICSHELGSQLVLKTDGKYSMDTAFSILEKLGFEVDDNVKGEIAEQGTKIQYENIVFQTMCSYEHIFINRISGNKSKFIALCDEISLLSQV